MYFLHSGSSSPMWNSFQPWYARLRTTSGWLRPTCRSACGPEGSGVRGQLSPAQRGAGPAALTCRAQATSLTGSSLAFLALRTGTMLSSSPGGRVWESCNRKSDGSAPPRQLTSGSAANDRRTRLPLEQPDFLFHNKSTEVRDEGIHSSGGGANR